MPDTIDSLYVLCGLVAPSFKRHSSGCYISLRLFPQAQFGDKTAYSIMFGPDKCGLSSKIHFIVRFKNPVTGEVEEKHSKQSDQKMDFFDDKKTHLFTLSKLQYTVLLKCAFSSFN